VDVKIYFREGFKLTEEASLSSGSNGTVEFTPESIGEYKFTASKEGYSNTSALVNVRECLPETVIRNTAVVVEQIPLPPPEKKDTRPEEQLPELTEEEVKWFSVLIFYFIVPLILATLLYLSSAFYDLNKDTLPWLLEIRIFFYEQRVKYDPQIRLVKNKLEPVVRPVAESMQAIYAATLKPTVDKLKNLRKKP
jgi:hypothetical protein